MAEVMLLALVAQKLRHMLFAYEEEIAVMKDSVIGVIDAVDSLRRCSKKVIRTRKLGSEACFSKEIKELVYDLEDVVDELVLRVERKKATCSLMAKLLVPLLTSERFSSLVASFCLRRLPVITNAMNELNKKIAGLLNFDTEDEDDNNNDDEKWRKSKISSVSLKREDDNVVGFEGYVTELMAFLLGKEEKGNDETVVVGIVGIGGIGKTTLARYVYNKIEIREEFDCRAWINLFPVHHRPKSEIMVDILQQSLGSTVLLSSSNIDEDDDNHYKKISKTVRSFLDGKSFLLVLDDICEIGIWETIKQVLPTGSRVILTTRDASLLSIIPECKNVLSLRGLSDEDAWLLFCKKAFCFPTTQPALETTLKPIGEAIVKRCRGLPLAIVTIACLLAQKNSEPSKWTQVLNQMDLNLSLSKTNNADQTEQVDSGSWTQELNQVMDPYLSIVLFLAYEDLPSTLKACFMYCSIFPEDYYELPAKKLCRLWLAEGFTVDLSLDDTKPDVEPGKFELNQLIMRNMIKAVKVGINGELETCMLLRPMRTFCNIYSNLAAISMNDRRLFLSWPGEKDSAAAATLPKNLAKLRSFKLIRRKTLRSLNSQRQRILFPIKKLEKLELVRVLDLCYVHLKELPSTLGNLCHLQYLELRGTGIKKLPSSLKHLRNLQTLDIRDTSVQELPSGLNFPNLMYLFLGSSLDDKVVTLPLDIRSGKSLLNLRKLAGVKITMGLAQALGALTHLQKLSGGQVRKEMSGPLCTSLNKSSSLASLTLKCAYLDRFNLGALEILATLSKLKLEGQMENFDSVAQCNSLKCLYLCDTMLDLDPLSVLQHLTNLVHLSMYNVYKGKVIGCNSDGFPKLKELSIIRFKHLEVWRKIEGGAMRRLERLRLAHCPKLCKLPEGLVDLDSLRAIEVVGLPFKVEDNRKIRCIPECINYPS